MESDRFLIPGIGVNKFLLLLKLISSGLLLFATEAALILRFLRVLYWNIMGQKSWPPALGLPLTLISSTQAPSWTQPHAYVFGTLPSSPYIQTLFIPTHSTANSSSLVTLWASRCAHWWHHGQAIEGHHLFCDPAPAFMVPYLSKWHHYLASCPRGT